MNTLKIKKFATNVLVFVATLITCFILLIGSCVVGGFTVSIIADAAIPSGQYTSFFNGLNYVFDTNTDEDINGLYFAQQPKHWGTASPDAYITPSFAIDHPDWIGKGFILAWDRFNGNNAIQRYYFSDTVTQAVYKNNGIYINGSFFYISTKPVEDVNNPGDWFLYSASDISTSQGYRTDSAYLSTSEKAIIWSSVPVYDSEGNLIVDGYEEFIFNPRSYQIQQPINSYYHIGGYVYNELDGEYYDGILNWKVYEGKTSSAILYEQTTSITNTVVIDSLNQTEFKVDTATWYTLSPRDLYQNSFLEYEKWYTAVMTIKPSFYTDNREYIIGYWFFKYDSASDGQQSQTNDYLNDDKYEDTADNIKDAINKNNDRIQSQFDFIGNISDNVNIDDIEGALNLEVDDSTSVYWFLRSLANSERVGYLLLVVITIGLLAYILFGKVN